MFIPFGERKRFAEWLNKRAAITRARVTAASPPIERIAAYREEMSLVEAAMMLERGMNPDGSIDE